jgi:hypothetical protein
MLLLFMLLLPLVRFETDGRGMTLGSWREPIGPVSAAKLEQRFHKRWQQSAESGLGLFIR